MYPYAHIMRLGLRARKFLINNWKTQGLKTQEEVLKTILSSGNKCAYYRTYDPNAELLKKGVDPKAGFADQFPVQDYEQLREYINSMLDGNENVLWPGKIDWFAKSSGTTSDRSKFLPINRKMLFANHYKGAQDLMSLYFSNYPKSRLYAGKGIVIGGSHEISHNAHVRFGDLSAILVEHMPLIGRLVRAPGKAVTILSDWEEKLDKMAKATIPINITHIAGIPTWTIVFLEHVLRITGKQHVHEVWPDFELFIHGGVNFDPYINRFEELFPGGKVRYWQTYNASEGFFGLQDEPDRDDMLLMLDHGVYYEFLPLDQLGKPKPTSVGLANVRLDTDYALVISTLSGLWRYLIGDTVRFTSLAPYRIRITGRTKHFINTFGEELMVDNAEQALKMACTTHNATVRNFTAAPVFYDDGQEGRGGHQWCVEFEQAPADVASFIDVLDEALQALNSDYAAKRFQNMVMRPLTLRILKKGTFEKWLKQKGKLGGQHKVPRLSNKRDFIEELLLIDR